MSSKSIIKTFFLASVLLLGTFSCQKEELELPDSPEKVLLMYAAGFNSLSSYIKEDINDVINNEYIPAKNEDILLIFSKTTISGYANQTAPTLTRIYLDKMGAIVRDTLLHYPKGTIAASAETLHDVLTYINRCYPDCSYGMVFSSHCTGWLPNGYYANPSYYENSASGMRMARQSVNELPHDAVPFFEPIEEDPNLPAVKSIGQEVGSVDGVSVSYEMELNEFVAAIPMFLDYIIFDDCYMGGVEVAYAMRNVCGYIGASQTEVIADGFDYSKHTSNLLQPTKASPEGFCRDYFNFYSNQTRAEMRSATISLINCGNMESLVEVCRSLNDKYRASLATLRPNQVQGYYRHNRHFFFDLEDIYAKAGANESDLSELRAALDRCIAYKAATSSFLSSFDIEVYSGMSMYIPSTYCGTPYLDSHYLNLDWNRATGLVL